MFTAMVEDLPPLQTGAAAWRGAVLAERDDWILHLTAEQVSELEAAAKPLVEQGDKATQALAHLAAPDFALPTLAPVLASMRGELLEGRGFILVRGLPIERYSRLQAATQPTFWDDPRYSVTMPVPDPPAQAQIPGWYLPQSPDSCTILATQRAQN